MHVFNYDYTTCYNTCFVCRYCKYILYLYIHSDDTVWNTSLKKHTLHRERAVWMKVGHTTLGWDNSHIVHSPRYLLLPRHTFWPFSTPWPHDQFQVISNLNIIVSKGGFRNTHQFDDTKPMNLFGATKWEHPDFPMIWSWSLWFLVFCCDLWPFFFVAISGDADLWRCCLKFPSFLSATWLRNSPVLLQNFHTARGWGLRKHQNCYRALRKQWLKVQFFQNAYHVGVPLTTCRGGDGVGC